MLRYFGLGGVNVAASDRCFYYYLVRRLDKFLYLRRSRLGKKSLCYGWLVCSLILCLAEETIKFIRENMALVYHGTAGLAAVVGQGFGSTYSLMVLLETV